MVCKVQQGNSLFKDNKEMVCLSASRRSFMKSQQEDGL